MTADACGVLLEAGPAEATAIGNVLVQAMALGDIKSLAELRAVVRASCDCRRYAPKQAAEWGAAYSRFRGIL